MFCGNCGTKLDPDSKFCPNCGSKVPELKQVSTSVSKQNQVSKPVVSVPKEKFTPKNPSKSLKFLLVLALACFFFPFVTVSCAGDNVTASGYEVMTAISFQEEYDFSEFSANTYLVLAFLLGCIGVATTKKEKSLTVPGIASAGATISLLLFRFKFYSFYGIEAIKNDISIEFRWGWWLALLLLLAATGTAINSYSSSQTDTQNISNPKQGDRNIDISPPDISSSTESGKNMNSSQPEQDS